MDKQIQESWEGKITDHIFNGDCCYNNNEGGKGHLECRYPFNPEVKNPQGKQCLKLKEEHFDIKSFLSLALKEQREEIVEKVLKIIDDNDPQTGNKVNPRYWGKTLRDDISSLIK